MPRIELQTNHEKEIERHGELTFPHECCGFMLGQVDGDVRTVQALAPQDNDRDDGEKHNRFTISPRAFMQAERTAKKQGMKLLGFYHSHPNAPARPSAYDLEHAWPWYSYVIVSILDGTADKMTSWVLRDDRSQFDEEAIVVADRQETV